MAFIKKVLKIKENKNNKNERFMSEKGSFFYAKFKNNHKQEK